MIRGRVSACYQPHKRSLLSSASYSVQAHKPPPWRPATILDEWVKKEVRPISLRQLTFFGRALTEPRLLSSANYVRTELPTRLAHRLRDMQTLPYVVVANPHISMVYELYYKAFERFRTIPEIKSLDDNNRYCDVLRETLKEHLTVIPNLAMGVLECQGLVKPDEIDRFLNTMLRARISRRVIAEQHLALTETFNTSQRSKKSQKSDPRADRNSDFVGEVFLKCNAKDVVERCGKFTQELMRQSSGSNKIPEINIKGHLDATFPYILGHLEYIIGELLRNSIQAVMEKYRDSTADPPPIEVLICEASQYVTLRISDRGGGVPREIFPTLWSFSKGPRTQDRLENLGQVPTLAATMQELEVPLEMEPSIKGSYREGSLSTLSSRPPNLRLGMGLPMSRVYAEYWAGSLELHSLEGYGVDAFLQISKLGNKNEQVTARASVDAV
ncbi:hypothetical protein ZTR_02231 [Talaromyces verruculosus]|nr:hypothetical protein ZTR_02231 [Talaromyces verruculosus]